MFGNKDDQQQPTNVFGGVDPSAGSSPVSPQFPASFPSSLAPANHSVPGLQDLTVPEISAASTPDESSVQDKLWSPTPTSGPVALDDLASLKQQALSQLTPIVGHLDQTPEEKFRTTMMMIQASDDQSLIRSAYDAAQAITDEKTKAQALLDVINEINYFSQKNQQ